MLQAVRATYDGKNFVPDENLNLSEGQKAVVTILDGVEPLRSNDESVDAYLAKLRKERALNLNDYMGVGEKMFASTEEIDNYIKELRNDDRF